MAAATLLSGLIGRDIGASRSPQIHEREADAQGIRLTYKLIDLAERPRALQDILDAAAMLDFAGLNVTHPYKQAIIPLLDDIAEDARRIGAVNTVVRRDGRWIGYNTDGIGFGDGLKRALPDADLSRVVQFGAGGAGSATADALLSLGTEELTLIERDVSKAEALAARLCSSFPEKRVRVAASLDRLDMASGVVNASPVGMYGYAGTPFAPTLLSPAHWVADIVYFPRETELLRAAKNGGCRTVDGSGMVVFQAARAFELFTGLTADRARMLAEFERA